MITVFTPTYNRAHLLERVYNSLEAQTSKDFEWIVVDDGSADNTEDVIAKFQAKATFPIRFYQQPNGGKHRAVNRGVEEALGELFFIVDADDWLPVNAIEWVKNTYEGIKDDGSFAGVCGLDSSAEGKIVGSWLPQNIIDCNAFDICYKYHVKGDLKEVFRTAVLKEIPFPEFDGEKFCPEALPWNRIAKKYKLRYVNEPIYYCEYQNDGLTANIMKVRHFSPLASMTTYAELYHAPIPLRLKIKAAINYWRFTPTRYYRKINYMHMVNLISLFALPLGILMRLNDKRHI